MAAGTSALDGITSPYSHFPDEQWFQTIVRSLSDRNLGLPGFPSSTTQEIFVGQSGERALKEAFDFYKLIKSRSKPSNSDTKVLDFGVGWGRIIRFFSKDIATDNLYGVDVDQSILNESKSLGVPGNLQLIDPTGRLPFDNDTFEIVYAFSVFSHLSEESAKIWLAELMRVMKPGGTLVITTMTNRFLDLCAACKRKTGDLNHFEQHLAVAFDDPDGAIEAYRNGRHVYGASGGHSDTLLTANYGWAAMPLEFVQAAVKDQAGHVEFFDDPAKFEQGVFVITKKSDRPIIRFLRSLRSK